MIINIIIYSIKHCKKPKNDVFQHIHCVPRKWTHFIAGIKKIFGVLLIQTKFGLQLPFSDRFSTNRNSDSC